MLEGNVAADHVSRQQFEGLDGFLVGGLEDGWGAAGLLLQETHQVGALDVVEDLVALRVQVPLVLRLRQLPLPDVLRSPCVLLVVAVDRFPTVEIKVVKR